MSAAPLLRHFTPSKLALLDRPLFKFEALFMGTCELAGDKMWPWVSKADAGQMGKRQAVRSHVFSRQGEVMPHFRALSRRNLITQSTRILSAAALVLSADAALAHHGWSWAQSEQMTLEGRITQISMAPPHPTLAVEAADGGRWQVDLGNPAQTERSGFKASSAKVGDAITVRGNRDLDAQKRHMKAVRITIDGKNYDMYPERLRD